MTPPRARSRRVRTTLALIALAAAASVATAQSPAPASGFDWTAGADSPHAATYPSAAAPDGAAATGPTAAEPKKGGNFVAAVIPQSDPTLGSGLGVAGMWMFRPKAQDTESPPSVIGAGGFYTDSGSWAAGFGTRLHLARDRVRLLLVGATARLRYDLHAKGTVGGDADLSVKLEQEGLAVVAEGLYRVRPHLYAGLRWNRGSIDTSLRERTEPPPILPRERELAVELSSLAPRLSFDSRDSQFYPTRGWLADFSATLSDEAWGADFDFQRYEAQGRSYSPHGEKNVLAWRAAACAVDGDAPFFSQCLFGAQGLLRGYSVGRYQDDALLAGEIEWRHRFARRWTAVGFAGAGGVAPSLTSLSGDDVLPSAGAGIRWMASKEHRVNLRVDVAWGNDDPALHVGIGEAF